MNQIFVVEGKSDIIKLKSVWPDAHVIATGGFSYGDDLIKELQVLSETNEIILLLDPDFAGEKIRHHLVKNLKNVKHIYAPKELCQAGYKIGVEHLSNNDLKLVLENLITYDVNKIPDISTFDLYKLGLTGCDSSKELRNKICSKLHIRSRNTTDFLRKITYLKIDLKRLTELCHVCA